MRTEQRIGLGGGTTIHFDTSTQEMIVRSEVESPEKGVSRKPVSASEWWETIMLEPFTFAAGPWHFARGSVAAKLSSGADVTGEGAEMEYGIAREPLRDALKFAIETNIPTQEVFDQINRGAADMKSNKGIMWADLYSGAVKTEYNHLREEVEIETSATH